METKALEPLQARHVVLENPGTPDRSELIGFESLSVHGKRREVFRYPAPVDLLRYARSVRSAKRASGTNLGRSQALFDDVASWGPES